MNQNKKGRASSFAGVLLLVCSACFAAVAMFLIQQKLDGYQENETIYDEIEEEVITQVPSDESDGAEDIMTIDWEKLDGGKVVAWIQFDAGYTDIINYPVVQGTDNSYYLNHAFDGQKNGNGSIFMNFQNTSDLSDDNTIIYGHNCKSGKMFGTLKNHRDPDFGDDKFYIYLPDGTRHTYEIFSVAEVQDAGFAYQYLFPDVEAYTAYQEELKAASCYDTGVTADPMRRVVTLSTCSSVGSKKGRRLVVAGLETEILQVQEPASWYNTSG